MSAEPRPIAVPPPFAAIYRDELAYVWSSLRRLGIAGSDLEDVCHEVFVVVHRRLGDYDASRPLRPWLFGIAFRVASAFRRRNPPVSPLDGERLIDEHSLGPLDLLENKRQRARVLSALHLVPLEQRSVLILHDIDGVAAPEIADTLGIPLGTAYSRLRAGRAAFIRAIDAIDRGSNP